MSQARTICVRDPACGLVAFIALDSLALGPAAGGIRTMAYPSEEAALDDARRLARAMTVKCAISGLEAGGGKAVVMAHPALNRRDAFLRLGEAIEELNGDFRTAGDVGTRAKDLANMAEATQWVHQDEDGLTEAVAHGLLACLESGVSQRRDLEWPELSVAIQGCGAIGSAVAHALSHVGMQVSVSDIVAERAERIAQRAHATPISPDAFWDTRADVISPCALGGVLTAERAATLRGVRIVCGAANNILADKDVEQRLQSAGITWIPDVLASAGAVVRGIARSVMQVDDPSAMIARLGTITTEVLEQAQAERRLASEVIETRVQERLSAVDVAL